MTKTIRKATTAVREELSETINIVAFSKQRVILNRHGKDVAAVIPLEDLKLLERMSEDDELSDTLNALIEAREKGSTSWEEIKANLGL